MTIISHQIQNTNRDRNLKKKEQKHTSVVEKRITKSKNSPEGLCQFSMTTNNKLPQLGSLKQQRFIISHG